ncbi:MAG: DUF4199 domain-containing protein [Bacteroidaceae bacterium]|nr:DUF4199 domain-containing protein [Bacteroidaceae bacterium]
MNTEHFSFARSFASEYGIILGISWGISFLLFVMTLTHLNIIFSFLFAISFIILPFIAIYLGWRFKQHLNPGEKVSFAIAWFFAFLLIANASLVCAGIEFGYLQFFDKGAMMDAINQIVRNPETETFYRQMAESSKKPEIMNIYNTNIESLNILSSASPLELTISLLSQNITLGFFLSFVVAFVASRRCSKVKI